MSRETANQLGRRTLIEATEQMLALCSKPERDLFAKMYPDGIKKLTGPDLRSAHDVCVRTLI